MDTQIPDDRSKEEDDEREYDPHISANAAWLYVPRYGTFWAEAFRDLPQKGSSTSERLRLRALAVEQSAKRSREADWERSSIPLDALDASDGSDDDLENALVFFPETETPDPEKGDEARDGLAEQLVFSSGEFPTFSFVADSERLAPAFSISDAPRKVNSVIRARDGEGFVEEINGEAAEEIFASLFVASASAESSEGGSSRADRASTNKEFFDPIESVEPEDESDDAYDDRGKTDKPERESLRSVVRKFRELLREPSTRKLACQRHGILLATLAETFLCPPCGVVACAFLFLTAKSMANDDYVKAGEYSRRARRVLELGRRILIGVLAFCAVVVVAGVFLYKEPGE